ncbi:MAG: hypothetical protein ONB05_02375, partial [candidate division KSB1 bacterium]|nr:hypothetical protein [candidate division KSB1 bacterium]
MKRSNKKRTITRIAFVSILLVILALGFIGLFRRETSLIDLQKAILVAETEEERQRILERLDNYYLTLSIPDSIRRRVQAEVASPIVEAWRRGDEHVSAAEMM